MEYKIVAEEEFVDLEARGSEESSLCVLKLQINIVKNYHNNGAKTVEK